MEALHYYQYEVDIESFIESFSEDARFIVHEQLADFVCSELDTEVFADDTLVDIASGPGISLMCFLKRLGMKKGFAIDGSAQMINYLNRTKMDEYEINSAICNVLSEALPVPDSSTKIATCLLSVGYLSSIGNLFSEASRILKPEGYFIADLISYKQQEWGQQPQVCENVNGIVNMYYYADKYVRELAEEHSLEIYAEHSSTWEKSELCLWMQCTHDLMIFRKKKK
ncbi:MAG: class I SAM-dependent methyltransferase [Patescibacteria group bacterium]